MPTVADLVAYGANRLLAPFGYEARLKILNEKPEGFPGYAERAHQAGMDVNEWEERFLDWKPSRPIVEHLLYPLLRDDSVVCEVGPGTGRFSRDILQRIPRGQLILVDHSAWMVRFLAHYFRQQPNVSVLLTDGASLPTDQPLDVFFSGGTFIAFKLGVIHLYLRDLRRILKPGGYAVFDYLDTTHAEAWAHLETQGAAFADVYTFHAPETIDRLATSLGFTVQDRWRLGKSTYITLRYEPGASTEHGPSHG